MYRTTRPIAFLIFIAALVTACTETSTSSTAGGTKNETQIAGKTGSVRGGKNDPKRFEPRSFTLTANKYELTLAGKGGRPQTVSTDGEVVALSFNGEKEPTLSTVKIRNKPVVFMGLHGPYFHKFSLDRLGMSIESDEQGRWKLVDKVSGYLSEISPYSCEDVYMTSNDGELYLVNPPKPIAVTVDGFDFNFLREGKSDGIDVPNNTAVILAPCDEISAEPRSFVYQGGGLGTVILVDNIIDPELVTMARDAGSSDAYQAKGAEAFMSAVKDAEGRYTGKKCASIEEMAWSDRPEISIQFGFPETSMTIYCDTWLVVDDGNEKRCFNIVTCGAKIELDGGMVHVYSGCPENPSQDCPM